jgi:polyphenol oxidase
MSPDPLQPQRTAFPSTNYASLVEDVSEQGLVSAPAGWPDGVSACMTSRRQGVSVAPFESWNLGDHVGDQPEAVARNRERLRDRIGARPVFLRQVHGTTVAELGPDSPDGLEADACWTQERGLACTVMVADCLPLLLSAPDGSSVAAVHAGWRGLLGQGGHGVLEALCEAWPAARTPAQRAGLRVWLGPCIGPAAFEVGAEVRSAFVAADSQAATAFRPVIAGTDPSDLAQKFLADLPALARQRLARLGIVQIAGNDGNPDWCTVSQSSVFFSHRRDAGRLGSTGRMAGCIWRG